MSSRLDSEACPPPVAPRSARRNPLRSRADWEAMRAAVLADPGAFHGTIARRNLHWFVPGVGAVGAWLSFDDRSGTWSGWDAGTGAPVAPALDAGFAPW
ncbi:MAG: hypothetical protein ACK558_02015, partial [Pseudomonadota bacterium]